MFGSLPAFIAGGSDPLTAAILAVGAPSLAHLSALDLAVIAIYFVMVIWIGFYLKCEGQHQRRVLHGRSRDDGVDCRPQLSFPPTWARWN